MPGAARRLPRERRSTQPPTASPTSRPCRRCSTRRPPSAICARAWRARSASAAATRPSRQFPTARSRSSSRPWPWPRAGQACWIARDAEIGDRVADELVAWLGDAEGVAVLEPRSALAYERSELIRDESAARVATLARWRSGRARILVASVQALLQPTITPADLPSSPRVLRRGDRLRQDELLGELLRLGYEPVLEVAGRGEMARRGGLVDLFPAGADLPARIELFGDEIDEIRLFDPTDQRTVRPVEAIELLPANEFLVPAAGVGEIRVRLGRLAGHLPERLAADLARLEGADAPAAAADATASPGRPGPRRGRRGRGLVGCRLPVERPRPPRPRHTPRRRRAGRGRRRGRVPVGAGRGAAARPRGRGRAPPGNGRRPTWSRGPGRPASSLPAPWR